ncbi:MAG TPA: hypothetical protein VNT01_15770 [Symbiobacteriaceae bacterium]|nr:hypothetical protein [Symbiobacteriaceae bacterium]
MQRIKEFGLNGLLAVLVAVSIVLSYRVWFPSDQGGLWRPKEASVQTSPPPQPEIFKDSHFHRPERIYVQRPEGQTALLPAGSLEYLRVWNGVKDLLTDLRPTSGPMPLDEAVDRSGESVTLVLPISLTLDHWAQLWDWKISGLPNFSLKVDRVTVYLGKTPIIYFTGLTGVVFRVGPLPEGDQKRLKGLLAEIGPERFKKYRPLAAKDSAVKLASGLMVPDVTEMPEGMLAVEKPDGAVEQARYFPDLSVVRHIEEKDANSFTDGQRWLRLTDGGQTEYVTAPPAGAPPDLLRSREAAREWVLSHGGWPQDLVLNEYVQQPGRSVLVYNLRLDGGAFPIESAGPVESFGGAIRLELTLTRDQVVTVRQYRRYPNFTPSFTGHGIPVKPAETALQTVAAQFPSLFLFEGELREMHLAYLIYQPDKYGTWKPEPVWVIQIGEKRVYTPAALMSDLKSFVSGA